MQLHEIRNGSILIELDPGVCLAIAEACWAAGDYASEEEHQARAGLWAILRCAFESLALIGAAKGYGTGIELSDFSLADVRTNWAILPEMKETKS